MRGALRLVRNGNSTHVSIPKPVLEWLGWNPGELVWFEVREDRSITYRRPRTEDFVGRLDVGPAPAVPEAVTR
jgi:antitoxin component of MazEF toxin-antitoxin module